MKINNILCSSTNIVQNEKLIRQFELMKEPGVDAINTIKNKTNLKESTPKMSKSQILGLDEYIDEVQ